MLKSEATKLENQRKMREHHAKEQADYLELKLLWAARASASELVRTSKRKHFSRKENKTK